MRSAKPHSQRASCVFILSKVIYTKRCKNIFKPKNRKEMETKQCGRKKSYFFKKNFKKDLSCFGTSLNFNRLHSSNKTN